MSESKSASHPKETLVFIATSETSHSKDEIGGNGSSTDDYNEKDGVKGIAEEVDVQESGNVTPVNEKHELQDQTNLLPVKQVLIVFAGLSCALFCKFLCFALLPNS